MNEILERVNVREPAIHRSIGRAHEWEGATRAQFFGVFGVVRDPREAQACAL